MPQSPQLTGALEVFFSYAHEDEALRKRLEQHFSFLRREGKLAHWHDGEIKAGEEWRGKIERRLNSADVILLLVSAAFADSDFCFSIEMERAMERHNAGEAVVVPILLHPCDWQRASFAKLQMLPGGDEAISEWLNTEKALYEVARGVREVIEGLIAKRSEGSQPITAEEQNIPSAQIPPPPAIEFVPRKYRGDRDIVEHLKRELTRTPKRLIVLWGEGGVGKTTIAAEAVRAMSGVFGERVVWASAEKRADFTYSTLLNEIATQLGDAGLTKLATEPKELAVRQLIAVAPTLVVLDNFETVSPDERNTCADFLATRAQCAALITTRERVSHDSARHVHVESMDDEEAHEFVERWVGQEAHDPRTFEGLDYDEIIRAADARPFVLQWVLARINLALEPRAVLDELTQAEGEVGERVFKRSFELPQLGDDGRDTLLALSLFTPSASRQSLAEVAGFGNDRNRLDEAVKRLAALRLIETTPGGQRLIVEGLTRSQAQSRLSIDKRANEFRRRYVVHFLRHVQAHAEPTPEDLDVLEAEKDNLLGAIDAAFRMQDWDSVMEIRSALDYFIYLHGYWDEAIRSGEQAEAAAREEKYDFGIALFTTSMAAIRMSRGEYEEAGRVYREALEIFGNLGSEENVACCLHCLGMIAQAQSVLIEARQFYGESLEINKRLSNQRDIAATLHELGRLAQSQGDLEEALRFYGESLEISKGLDYHRGIANTTSQIGIVLGVQGELEKAKVKHEESLSIRRKLGEQRGIAVDLHQLGLIAKVRGDLEEAQRLYIESLGIHKRLGDQDGIASTLGDLGLLAEEKGNKAEAAQLLREALRIFEKLGSSNLEKARKHLASVEDGSD